MNYPKYSEDLVYSEVMIPEGAPEKLKDRTYLWNSIENLEKRKDAQVARTFRLTLPNEWSYDLATEVMRDYVKKNFVDEGMCCDFAIHDSENKTTHQRNLHCHIMLTMRPLNKDGTWGDKQHLVYDLDENGEKIKKKNGRYKSHTVKTTDWDSKEKATLWRKYDTEIAVQIADRFISIQEATEGYDYTIFGPDYKEIDGGIYDNPDISIWEALEDIVADLKNPRFDSANEMYYRSTEQGNVKPDDKMIMIDYDRLIDLTEEANKTVSDIVQQFKERTKEHFHEIGGCNDSDITDFVLAHLQEIIMDNEMDITIDDIAITGSRCRGMERKDSDLDIVVQVRGGYKEDYLFNIFNEKEFTIGGIKVDINPIMENETGTFETYLPKVEQYLAEKEIQKQKKKEKMQALYKNLIAMKNEEAEEDNCNCIDGIPNNSSIKDKEKNKAVTQYNPDEYDNYGVRKSFLERLEEKKQFVKERDRKSRSREEATSNR